MELTVTPIGYVRATRQTPEDDDWGGSVAAIELADRMPAEALVGMEAFSHAEIIFVFDQVDPAKIVTGARRPRNNPAWPAVGIFAQRGKNRPNRLGLTTVRILGVAGRRLHVAELDAIDGTPVLDIKPVLAEFLPRTPVIQPAWSYELMRDYWRVPDPAVAGGTPAPPVTVRPARPGDTPFIRSLAPRLAAVGVPPWRDPAQAQGFHTGEVEAAVAAIGAGGVLIAVRGDESLGVIHLQEQRDFLTGAPQAYLALLAVAAVAEGQGVGQQMLAAAERWARECGYRHIALDTFAGNERARRLYLRHGYHEEVYKLVKPLGAEPDS
ncbi:MAG: GNAT family N-acetyltransferase [Chloroflexales bacterium]|nr:GNAT family N-acetyltransferase [Chloroflexales bacterium]